MMLNTSEKAYCLALLALKHKDYRAAVEQFDKAAPDFKNDKEFNLYRQSTRLLLAVRQEVEMIEDEDRIEIEEAFPNG